MMSLTEGAILIMSNPEHNKDPDFKPVLQVHDLKLVTQNNNSTTERYRMMISDGTHLQQGMLATQRNELVFSQRLRKGSVIQLNQFVTNVIQGRMIIIVIDLEVLFECCNPIGVSVPLQMMPIDDACSSNIGKGPVHSNLPLPNSIAEISENMVAFGQKLQELANKDASLQHEYEVEKKARADVEAALQELKQKLVSEQEANVGLREELDFIKTHGPLSSQPLANRFENATSFYGFFEDVSTAARDVGYMDALIALRETHPEVKLGGLPGADWARQELAAKKKALNDLFVRKVCDGHSFKLIG